MATEYQYLLHLLGAWIREDKPETAENVDWDKLIQLAQIHKVTGIVGYMGMKYPICPDAALKSKFRSLCLGTISLFAQRAAAAMAMDEALEKAGIGFLPLKGSVIRRYYPEEWMRTSCDIDVLVHREDIEQAKAVLIEKCGYAYHGTGSHDVSLLSPANVHVELHFDLVEDGIANESSKVLADVWNTAAVREGYAFWYEMPDEYYYFYHVAHMAKHFEHGGCGIRSLLDLWILDRQPEIDCSNRNRLLETGGLLKFADGARKLSRIWFGGEEYDLLSTQMEAYILRGGIYGTEENRVTIRQQQMGGRFKYALSRIFIPYNVIKFHYPILQKHPYLLPVMEVRRWFKLLFCGHAERTMRELQYNSKITDENALAMQRFLEELGLS
jgi:hypothetical protein